MDLSLWDFGAVSNLANEIFNFFSDIARNDFHHFSWLIQWLKVQTDVKYVKLIFNGVCKDIEQSKWIGSCEESISHFIPNPSSHSKRLKIAKDFLVKVGFIQEINVSDWVLLELVKSSSNCSVADLETLLRGDIKALIGAFIGCRVREKFFLKFLGNNVTCKVLRQSIHEIYGEQMVEGSDVWSSLTVIQKVERVLYDPFWSDKEDKKLIFYFSTMATNWSFGGREEMDLVCRAVVSSMSGNDKKYNLDAVKTRLTMWRWVYRRFLRFIAERGVTYKWENGLLNISDAYYNKEQGKESLLFKYFRIKPLPWVKEIKRIFEDERARDDILPEVGNYVKWDLLDGEENIK